MKMSDLVILILNRCPYNAILIGWLLLLCMVGTLIFCEAAKEADEGKERKRKG